METPTEATPAAAPAADLSLNEIIEASLKAAEASGSDIVVDDKPKPAADPPAETPPVETAPAEEPAADEPKPSDDVTAARVRKMLAEVDRREAELTARESRGVAEMLAEMRKSPKAFFAKHGTSLDDIIDASIAEGKDTPASAEADENHRLTALEKRIEDRERAEHQEKVNAAISAKKAEIHGEISKLATKFPIVNETKRQSLVTDYMVEYHATHGKPIPWDKAAAAIESDLTGLGIAAAKKLGWSPPAAAAAPAAATPPKDRPGTATLAGETRTAAPVDGDEPSDPRDLMRYLAAKHGVA